jgi:hypothetical protein
MKGICVEAGSLNKLMILPKSQALWQSMLLPCFQWPPLVVYLQNAKLGE